MNLYFIGLIPPAGIEAQVRSLKEEIRDLTGAEKALRLPAHITLQIPFRMGDEKEPELTGALDSLAQKEAAFDITLKGFGAFKPRTLFIKVKDHDPVVGLHERVVGKVEEVISLKDQERTNKMHPHMTIASRDLTKASFEKVWPEFKDRDLEETFKANSLFLFRHNGKTWDVYGEYFFGK